MAKYKEENAARTDGGAFPSRKKNTLLRNIDNIC